MKQLLLSILFVGAFGALQAQTTPSKTADIRKVLQMSGQAKAGVQVMEAMFGQFQQSLPQVPEEFWKEFMKEVSAEGLIDLIIPIYDKHFTHDDIRQLIVFYDSPIGKKLTATLPVITEESMTAGEKWGGELAEKVMERLQKKGYIKE